MSEANTGPWAVEKLGAKWAVKRPGLRAIYMLRDTKAKAQKACDDANKHHRQTILHEAAPAMLELVKLFERSVQYEIKGSLKDGDVEGARMKTITLNMIRDGIANATGSQP